MNRLILLLALALTGCGTYVHEDGQRVLSTFADSEGFEFRTPKGTVLRARRLIHSTHTEKAIGAASTGAVGIMGAAATGVVLR